MDSLSNLSESVAAAAPLVLAALAVVAILAWLIRSRRRDR